jgi:hypothetical protein
MSDHLLTEYTYMLYQKCVERYTTIVHERALVRDDSTLHYHARAPLPVYDALAIWQELATEDDNHDIVRYLGKQLQIFDSCPEMKYWKKYLRGEEFSYEPSEPNIIRIARENAFNLANKSIVLGTEILAKRCLYNPLKVQSDDELKKLPVNLARSLQLGERWTVIERFSSSSSGGILGVTIMSAKDLHSRADVRNLETSLLVANDIKPHIVWIHQQNSSWTTALPAITSNDVVSHSLTKIRSTIPSGEHLNLLLKHEVCPVDNNNDDPSNVKSCQTIITVMTCGANPTSYDNAQILNDRAKLQTIDDDNDRLNLYCTKEYIANGEINDVLEVTTIGSNISSIIGQCTLDTPPGIKDNDLVVVVVWKRKHSNLHSNHSDHSIHLLGILPFCKDNDTINIEEKEHYCLVQLSHTSAGLMTAHIHAVLPWIEYNNEYKKTHDQVIHQKKVENIRKSLNKAKFSIFMTVWLCLVFLLTLFARAMFNLQSNRIQSSAKMLWTRILVSPEVCDYDHVRESIITTNFVEANSTPTMIPTLSKWLPSSSPSPSPSPPADVSKFKEFVDQDNINEDNVEDVGNTDTTKTNQDRYTSASTVHTDDNVKSELTMTVYVPPQTFLQTLLVSAGIALKKHTVDRIQGIIKFFDNIRKKIFQGDDQKNVLSDIPDI